MQFQKRATIEAAPLQDEALLFYPEVNRFYVLNGTASYIWEQLPAPASAQEIAAELCRSYGGVAEPEALRDVEGALEQMLALSIVIAVPPTDRAEGATRADGPRADGKSYAPPRIQAMSEEEVLSAFQITQAGITWWTM